MFRDLNPGFRPWAQWIYEVAEVNGLRPRVTSGFRSVARQQELYDAYRAGRSKFPAARPGYSLHNYGLAIDFVSQDPQNRRLGRLWESVGGRWGGSFRSNDWVHFDSGHTIG